MRLTIFLLWLAGVLAAGQFAKVAVTFPLFREAYPGFGPTLGFLVSALSLMGLIFGLFSGMILSRLGFRRILLLALSFGGALSLLQASLPGFGLMLISRALEGAAHLMIVVAAPTLIGQIAPPSWRNTAMALWSTVFAVAFALFSWLGLPLAQSFGLPMLMILHGLLLWIMALILSRVLPIRPRTERLPPLTLREIIAKHVAAYSSPSIAAPAAGWLFYAMSFVAIVTVFPDFLPDAQRGVISGVMPLAALSVSMTLGISLLRHVSPVTVLITGFVLAAVLALCLSFGESLGPARAWVAVAMLGALGLVQSGSFASIPMLNTTPEDQSLANGALAQTGNAGNLIGTPLLLWLVDRFGMTGLIGFAVLVFCAGAMVHLWLMTLRKHGARRRRA
ncbi:Predicted arabinose efflux permease, MFS family [Celeribacter neptunius]|uniref:Predicted arabinose efflux permease, MFS family n=1 Tax=Celeribacter neptunius TaxID=588602 RepID=A0A1I3RZZ5_9RHOB|nr:Predicted arabinose efflux permease, MFS family [Celeribacter neptunius]